MRKSAKSKKSLPPRPVKPRPRKPLPSSGTRHSIYRGVTWAVSSEAWQASIQSDEAHRLGIPSHLGYFSTEDAAAEAYNEAVRIILEDRPMDIPIGHGHNGTNLRAYRLNFTRTGTTREDLEKGDGKISVLTNICRVSSDIPDGIYFGRFSNRKTV